jgi:hypothetical protein
MWQNTDLEILDLLGSLTTAASTSPTGNVTLSGLGTATAGTDSSTNLPNTHIISPKAKAEIAVGIVVVSVAFVLGIFFCFRRRGQRQKYALKEKPLPANTHELFTAANTHELLTKHNIPEMDEQNGGELQPFMDTRVMKTDVGDEIQGDVIQKVTHDHELVSGHQSNFSDAIPSNQYP